MQRLVDGMFDLAVLLLDVANFMRYVEVAGGRFRTQQAVALLGLGPFFGIQRVNGGAQVIGARYTTDLPQAPFEPFDQRLEASEKQIWTASMFEYTPGSGKGKSPSVTPRLVICVKLDWAGLSGCLLAQGETGTQGGSI